MKKLISFLAVLVLLTGCGGGDGDSSSGGGGGGDINIAGTWRVVPFLNIAGVTMTAFTVRLTQNGNNVTAEILSQDPIPPGFASCGNDRVTSFTGVVAGNTFNGSAITAISTTQFSVSGSSNAMSGTFTLNVHTGRCAGSGSGTVTMTRI